MKLLAFLLIYVRKYWRWAVLALGATVLYAASTVVLIQLLEPIFSEVLQIGSAEMPAGLGALLPAAAKPSEVGAPEASADTSLKAGEPPGGGATATPPPVDPLKEAKKARVFLDRILHDALEALKAALHVTPAQVIYFIPLLFVAIFILRSFSDFLNGYAFQHLGLGATNDLRNDLYARTLAQ
ncbi:MAG: hypothetical protein ABI689_18135, partial [Thermoanaerobaculia bacterium]